jgi:hypothetical protein
LKRIILSLLLCLISFAASAQKTVTVIGTIVPGDCAAFNSTSVIKDAGVTCGGGGSGTPGGGNGSIQYNNAGAFGGFIMTGDCTVNTATGIEICTKTNGVAFGLFATASATTATAALNLFTPTLQGLVPASGGGTTNFLRADGTFAPPPSASSRTVLTTPTTFFVSTAGTDAVGCGLVSGTSACRTRGYLVLSVLSPHYDLGGQTVTVQIADGTYTDSLQVLQPMLIGQAGAGGLIFTGNCTTPSNVLIQPGAGLGYTYGFAFGFSARIQCQKLDQTTGVRGGSSNDMITAGQGSSLLMGNPSLFGVRGDMIYGCNINPFNTFTIGPRGAYLEFDNDFTIDVGSCQQQTTGTVTNTSATVTAVVSTTNFVKYMGLIGTGIPPDAFVNTIVTNTSITFGCIYTSPCQASATNTGVTITGTGGGQSFIDTDSSNVFFTTNGDPSFSIIGTLANFPYYFSGWFFINDSTVANAQAITWINPGQGRGKCSVVTNLSILNTNFQGLPYLPCNSGGPEVSTSSSGAVTAGSSTVTLTSATGVKLGQVMTDLEGPTATWTAGSSTMVVSSNSGILVGAKVSGGGILEGAFVSNIAGTTITVAGCGAGPRCVTGSPLYLSETGIGVFFSNSYFSGGSVVTGISGTTITISDTIKNSGSAGNLWFEGQVTNFSLYK